MLLVFVFTLYFFLFVCFISSYPHGGYISAGLLLSSWAAFTATAYAVASCRFLELTFETDQGSFENHFSNSPIAGGSWTFFRASVGLFQWLRPVDASEWNKGSCVGYQESMLAVIQDSYFDIARSFSVIAVLMGIIVSCWTFITSCIAWNWLQLMILRLLLLVGAVTSGMSLIILKASMCNDAIPGASCELDEGGMVLIAGMILWLASFVISVVFFRSYTPQIEPEDDVEKARRVGARAASRAQRAKEEQHERRQRQLSLMARSAAVGSSPPSQKKSRVPTPPATTPKTPDTNINISFDSADSINSFENRQRGVKYLENQSQAPSLRSQRSVALTVDDVSTRNELEVYINEKMSRIKHLMDLSTLDDDLSAEI